MSEQDLLGYIAPNGSKRVFVSGNVEYYISRQK